jgi:hypothetical protein
MAKYKVWGDWQEYDEAATDEYASAFEAARSVAMSCDDTFPDGNDGDEATFYVRPADAKDSEGEDWNPAEDAATETFNITLHIRYEYIVEQQR